MTDASTLTDLAAIRAIEARIHRFGHCLDTVDWAALRSCFCDVVDVDFELLSGYPARKVDADR